MEITDGEDRCRHQREAADLLVEALNELGAGDVIYPTPIDNAIGRVEGALALLQAEDADKLSG
jgi:hypothetical protein